MKTTVSLLLVLSALVFCEPTARAQFLYQLTFRGTLYQTNSAGVIRGTPFTHRSILQEIATTYNLDVNSIALAYHVKGSPFGDTIDIINSKTGQTMDTLFGLFFGEDASLGRIALTNGTSQKRVDYIYTSQNSHSMGSAFVSRGQVTDSSGNQHLSVQGQAHWVVAPKGNFGIRIYNGVFNTGKPLPFGEMPKKSSSQLAVPVSK